jgi:hypothetical protein
MAGFRSRPWSIPRADGRLNYTFYLLYPTGVLLSDGGESPVQEARSSRWYYAGIGECLMDEIAAWWQFLNSMNTMLPTSIVPDNEQKPVYKLVIIYDNMESGKHANHFCDTLLQELGDTTLGTKDLWSFRVLDVPHARHTAAEAAATADAVILALEGDTELPDGLKAWMEEWTGRVASRVADQNPVLIALFGACDGRQHAVASTRAYLGAIAESARLTFLHTMRQACVEDQRAA